ncbi:MAG: sugar phosphate isomerase/epimerase [Treponema sp.]|jgi:sugar phosphate isomerase/epimerase|nr:sugar phosphate isomerase/epimerase [Treponema sp.]
MYKGFSSGLLGFGGRTLKEDVPLAVKYGYSGINFDIVTEAGKDPLRADAAEVKELLEKNGLKSGGFGLPVNYRESPDIFEEDLKKLPAYCEFARKTGSDRCITWIIPWSDTLDYRANYDQHKTRLARIAKILEDHGVRFGLEFVGPPGERRGKKYEFIHNLDGLLELLNDIGTSNLGILMDVWHWDMAGQTFDDFRKIPGNKWVVMVHINDAPAGIPVAEQKDLVRELPGATGVLKIADFMRGLTGLNYDGPVFVEPFYAPFRTMSVEDAVRAAKAAMDKVWPENA